MELERVPKRRGRPVNNNVAFFLTTADRDTGVVSNYAIRRTDEQHVAQARASARSAVAVPQSPPPAVFAAQGPLQEVAFDGSSNIAFLTQEQLPDYLVPEVSTSVCQCGAPWSLAERLACVGLHGRSPIVYGRGYYKEVSVYELRCLTAGCGGRASYDGGSDQLLNLNNLDLFTHDLLRW